MVSTVAHTACQDTEIKWWIIVYVLIFSEWGSETSVGWYCSIQSVTDRFIRLLIDSAISLAPIGLNQAMTETILPHLPMCFKSYPHNYNQRGQKKRFSVRLTNVERFPKALSWKQAIPRNADAASLINLILHWLLRCHISLRTALITYQYGNPSGNQRHPARWSWVLFAQYWFWKSEMPSHLTKKLL